MTDGLSVGDSTHLNVVDASDREFEEFLSSIGWRTIPGRDRACSPPMPSPAESPPALRLATKNSTGAPLSIHAKAGAVLTLVALLASMVTFAPPLFRSLAHQWGRGSQEVSGKDAVAEAYFQALRPGTRAEEVRNRVGLPWMRSPASLSSAAEAWHYATVPSGRGAKTRTYIVTMRGGVVESTVDITGLRPRETIPPEGLRLPQYVGELRVGFSREKPRLLSPADSVATLLVGGSVVQAVPNVPNLRTYRFERLRAEKGLSGKGPALGLYWRGLLYPLPLSPKEVSADTLADDLEWLTRRLGCDQPGVAPSP